MRRVLLCSLIFVVFVLSGLFLYNAGIEYGRSHPSILTTTLVGSVITTSTAIDSAVSYDAADAAYSYSLYYSKTTVFSPHSWFKLDLNPLTLMDRDTRLRMYDQLAEADGMIRFETIGLTISITTTSVDPITIIETIDGQSSSPWIFNRTVLYSRSWLREMPADYYPDAYLILSNQSKFDQTLTINIYGELRVAVKS